MEDDDIERFERFAHLIANDLPDDEGETLIHHFIEASEENLLVLVILLASWLEDMGLKEEEAYQCIRYAQQIAARNTFGSNTPKKEEEQ